MLLILSIFVITAVFNSASGECSSCSNKNNAICSRTLTLSNGAPVDLKSSTYSLKSDLLRNAFFIDTISAFTKERIPERVVHAKGAGASGFFEVTDDITDICKAKLFNKIGKRTKVFVRFSHATLDRGDADNNRAGKGFAIKFYTEEGNFDLVGFNTPMFFVRDPLKFQQVIRATKRHPVSNYVDYNTFWDMVTLNPQTIFFFMYVYGDNGVPASYKNMPGYSIHTYQLSNAKGKPYFVRFYINPDAGNKGLISEEDIRNADPDYLQKDLYKTIERGQNLTWTISAQVLTLEDVQRAEYDPFDLTKIIPPIYPMRRIGKLVLNRNPKNYFAEVEQVAYGPGNMVRGIQGGLDKIFEARILAYKEAYDYRLGSNTNKIKVNCPINEGLSLNRDGAAPVGDNGGDSPNYYPNSYGCPMPASDDNEPELFKVTPRDNPDDFSQARQYFEEMPQDERERMVATIVSTLTEVREDLKNRVIQLCAAVHPTFGDMMMLSALNKEK